MWLGPRTYEEPHHMATLYTPHGTCWFVCSVEGELCRESHVVSCGCATCLSLSTWASYGSSAILDSLACVVMLLCQGSFRRQGRTWHMTPCTLITTVRILSTLHPAYNSLHSATNPAFRFKFRKIRFFPF